MSFIYLRNDKFNIPKIQPWSQKYSFRNCIEKYHDKIPRNADIKLSKAYGGQNMGINFVMQQCQRTLILLG